MSRRLHINNQLEVYVKTNGNATSVAKTPNFVHLHEVMNKQIMGITGTKPEDVVTSSGLLAFGRSVPVKHRQRTAKLVQQKLGDVSRIKNNNPARAVERNLQTLLGLVESTVDGQPAHRPEDGDGITDTSTGAAISRAIDASSNGHENGVRTGA